MGQQGVGGDQTASACREQPLLASSCWQWENHPLVPNLLVFSGGKILMRSPGFHVKSDSTLLTV